LAAVVFDTEPADEAGVLGAVSATTLSVSWTAKGRSAVAAADEAAAVVTGVVGTAASGAAWADAGGGTAFCLDAR